MAFAAGGYMNNGLGSLAGIVDNVLAMQLRRFQAYVNKEK
jgi:hypothetical protein